MKIPENLRWKSIGKTLGSGGQGDVQLVIDKDDPDGRKYALKTLRNVGSHQALQRFQCEIDVVQRLSHPSIVPIVDYSESGIRPVAIVGGRRSLRCPFVAHGNKPLWEAFGRSEVDPINRTGG